MRRTQGKVAAIPDLAPAEKLVSMGSFVPREIETVGHAQTTIPKIAKDPGLLASIETVIPVDKHKEWFQQIWSGLTGASTKDHPAPYPRELAERLDSHVQLCRGQGSRSVFGDGNYDDRGGKMGAQ